MRYHIVEEIRKIRKNIEDEYGNDLEKHLEHIYEMQAKHGNRLVSRQPNYSDKDKPFDYTKWQRNLWNDKSIEKISKMAMGSRRKKLFKNKSL
jgi:hypothetical protein